MRQRFVAGMAAVVMGAMLVLPGSAQAPTYSVSWLAGPPGQEQTYTGTTTFVVDGKGVVTGKMTLTSPATVTGTLAGTVAKDTWTFEYPYEIPEQQCSGTVKGTAKVAAGRKTIQGTATIGGGCVAEPMASTFTFTLQEKK